jgi:hypothetical protein
MAPSPTLCKQVWALALLTHSRAGVPIISTLINGPVIDQRVRFHINMYPNGSVARYEGNASVFVHLSVDRKSLVRRRTRAHARTYNRTAANADKHDVRNNWLAPVCRC